MVLELQTAEFSGCRGLGVLLHGEGAATSSARVKKEGHRHCYTTLMPPLCSLIPSLHSQPCGVGRASAHTRTAKSIHGCVKNVLIDCRGDTQLLQTKAKNLFFHVHKWFFMFVMVQSLKRFSNIP